MRATNILNDTIQAVQAGLVPWEAVIEVQKAGYPRCGPHGVSTPMILDDEPICGLCIAEGGEMIRDRLRTLLPR